MNQVIMNDNSVSLRCSFNRTAQRLQVAYKIENLSGVQIYVLDGMFRLEGEPILDSQLAYTIIEGDLLNLFRGILWIPENLQVEAPDMPFARLLLSGGKLKGVIDSPVPLAFHQPYEWNDKQELRITQHVRLRIGYLAAHEVNPPPVMKMLSGGEVFYPKYRQVINIQRFLETPAQDETLSVLVRP